jgi:hypothetical protein
MSSPDPRTQHSAVVGDQRGLHSLAGMGPQDGVRACPPAARDGGGRSTMGASDVIGSAPWSDHDPYTDLHMLISSVSIPERAMMINSRQRTGTSNSRRIRRRIMAVAGGAAVVAMGVITAGCESTSNQAPSTSTTTTTTTTTPPPSATTASPASPTEKSINPTGGNLFTPQVIAPPAPTEPPGVHRHKH